MGTPRNIEAYPRALRDTLMTLATSSEAHEIPTKYKSHKKAVNDRARFYHLRKLMANKMASEGHVNISEKIFAVGMKLQENEDGTYDLILFNQHSGLSDELEDSLSAFLSKHGHKTESGVSAPIPEKDLKELRKWELKQLNDSMVDPKATNSYLSGDE